MLSTKPLLFTAIALLCAPTLSPAADANTSPPDAWQFRAALYAWLPSVGGTTTFPDDGGSDVSIDGSQLLDALKMTFMGSFGVQHGQWGAFTDAVYINLGTHQSATRDLSFGGERLPADASAKAEYDLKGWAWTLAASYRAAQDERAVLDLFAGARMLDVKQTFDWRLSGNLASIPIVDREGGVEAKLTNWDAIIGLKGQFNLGAGGQWFVPYYLDVGTGDSDLTLQAITGLGYATHWGDVLLAWRDLEYTSKPGAAVESLYFNGPVISVAYRW
ncbi:MAG TPA: hypothetical protein VF277_06615 [Steroidobacteraceae bacterium]